MSREKIIDEYSSLESPQKRYYARLMRNRRASGKCVRCPSWDVKDGILITKVRSDGSVYSKRLIYCLQHQEYVRERNKINRAKRGSHEHNAQ